MVHCLSITVRGARDLQDEAGYTIKDTFVQLRLSSSTTGSLVTNQCKTISNSPSWNFTGELAVNDSSQDILTVKIMNKRVNNNIFSHLCIGSFDVPVASLIDGSSVISGWHKCENIKNKVMTGGEIDITVTCEEKDIAPPAEDLFPTREHFNLTIKDESL